MLHPTRKKESGLAVLRHKTDHSDDSMNTKGLAEDCSRLTKIVTWLRVAPARKAKKDGLRALLIIWQGALQGALLCSLQGALQGGRLG